MALNKPQVELKNSPARPIELLTENDFSIVRAWEAAAKDPPRRGPYRFIVRDPDGYVAEIVVEIERDTIEEISIRSRGRILAENSYWIAFAERHLADYLSEHGDYPPEANLKIVELALNDLDVMLRWSSS